MFNWVKRLFGRTPAAPVTVRVDDLVRKSAKPARKAAKVKRVNKKKK